MSNDRYVLDADGYERLADVLSAAFWQASEGKGAERHRIAGEAFEDQIILQITRRVGLGYPLGQAMKKCDEATRMEPGAAIRELLGAINYIAAAVIAIEERDGNEGS